MLHINNNRSQRIEMIIFHLLLNNRRYKNFSKMIVLLPELLILNVRPFWAFMNELIIIKLHKDNNMIRICLVLSNI